MDRPKRIQLRRARGWRKPPGAVVVSRPSRWGNPYTIAEYGRERAIELYRLRLEADPELLAAVRRELAGKDLACWCPLEDADGNGVACHANVLLEIANPEVAP